MPNWTSCVLEAPEEVIQKYISKDENGIDRFDFNLVIPRPEIYDDPEMTSGFDRDWCIYWYVSDRWRIKRRIEEYTYDKDRMLQYCREHDEECYRRGEKYVNAFTNYGYYTWYDWSRANWGTKWNACNSDVSGWCVSFDTAWCYPEPVIRKIFEDNPGCLISLQWYDEDYDGDHWMIRNEDGTLQEGCDYNEHHYDEEGDE